MSRREQLLAEFATLMTMTRDDAHAFLDAPEAVQRQMIANKQGENWTPPAPSFLERVLEVLGVLAVVASDLSGIGSAALLLKSL